MDSKARKRSPLRRLLVQILVVLGAALIVMTGYLWFTFASPFGYQAPDDLATIESSSTHRVFVYGTLRKPWVRWLVMGRSGESESALLPGHRKQDLDIKPAPGTVVKGEVIEVSADELRRLDRYERLGVRYERILLKLDDGSKAWVYRLMKTVSLTPAFPAFLVT